MTGFWSLLGLFGHGLVTLLVTTFALLLTLPAQAADEPYYASRWCERMGGESEVVLESRDRVDCVVQAGAVAIEAEWGRKYREGLGQALDYGEQTGNTPGLLLLVESAEDAAGVERARAIIERYGLPIRVWVVDVR